VEEESLCEKLDKSVRPDQKSGRHFLYFCDNTMISIIDSARFKINKTFIVKVSEDYLRRCGATEDTNLNVIFVGKRKMLYIATVYKREPEALPVLSFSYTTNKKMNSEPLIISGDDIAKADASHTATLVHDANLLGEIFICYPQAVLLAAERNKKVDDTLQFLIEHGINNLINEK
jgi:ssRNA-specific RNase YbeY (16S rRNA maturation enzyme)